MRVSFQMSAHSKSFKLRLEEERKINNENKQAFGSRLPYSLFSLQNRVLLLTQSIGEKKTHQLRDWEVFTQWVLSVSPDLRKAEQHRECVATDSDNATFSHPPNKCLWITFSAFEQGGRQPKTVTKTEKRLS